MTCATLLLVGLAPLVIVGLVLGAERLVEMRDPEAGGQSAFVDENGNRRVGAEGSDG